MNRESIYEKWDYYLSIEEDLSNTSRYIEPRGQENVYSFEFAKLLILACIETESIFKQLCQTITNSSPPQDIGKYRDIILNKYPRIIEATVSIRRLGKTIKPFENWDKQRLNWWDAYQKIKHSREQHFEYATYLNAVYAISALHILILYLSKATDTRMPTSYGKYISSKYGYAVISAKIGEDLPDFMSN